MRQDLLSLPELKKAAHPHVPTIGVYFLFHGGKLMYVGQSINVEARIAQHWRTRRRAIMWDHVHVVQVNSQHEALALEYEYIRELDPPGNRQKPSDSSIVDKLRVAPTQQERRRQRAAWWERHGRRVEAELRDR